MSDITWRPAAELDGETVRRSRMVVMLDNGDVRTCLFGADICNTDVFVVRMRRRWWLANETDLHPIAQFAIVDGDLRK